MLLLKKAFYLFSWIRYSKITMLKGQSKISRREALIFFPRGYKEKMQWLLLTSGMFYPRGYRANAVTIIKCDRQVYSTHDVLQSSHSRATLARQ